MIWLLWKLLVILVIQTIFVICNHRMLFMDLANNNQKKIRINKKIPQSLPEIGTFSRIVFSLSVSAKTEKFILALVYVSAKNKIGFFSYFRFWLKLKNGLSVLHYKVISILYTLFIIAKITAAMHFPNCLRGRVK